MPNNAAAPNEADALRRMAEAAKRVHFSATFLQFILALVAALLGRKSETLGLPLAIAPVRTWRTPLRDWHFSPNGETIDDLAPVLSPGGLRRLRQQRAWIGWVLRCLPGLGMRPSGQRAPAPSPLRTARAPPWAAAHPISS